MFFTSEHAPDSSSGRLGHPDGQRMGVVGPEKKPMSSLLSEGMSPMDIMKQKIAEEFTRTSNVPTPRDLPVSRDHPIPRDLPVPRDQVRDGHDIKACERNVISSSADYSRLPSNQRAAGNTSQLDSQSPQNYHKARNYPRDRYMAQLAQAKPSEGSKVTPIPSPKPNLQTQGSNESHQSGSPSTSRPASVRAQSPATSETYGYSPRAAFTERPGSRNHGNIGETSPRPQSTPHASPGSRSQRAHLAPPHSPRSAEFRGGNVASPRPASKKDTPLESPGSPRMVIDESVGGSSENSKPAAPTQSQAISQSSAFTAQPPDAQTHRQTDDQQQPASTTTPSVTSPPVTSSQANNNAAPGQTQGQRSEAKDSK